MARRRLGAVLAVLVFGLALSGCAVPDTQEQFVRKDMARDGIYVYTLPLTDTTAAYDFWFYSRTEYRRLESLQLNVQWLAPSGVSFRETVYMRCVEPKGSKELYRSGMVPAEAGDWKLSVRPVGVDEDFLGLGVICRKQDGTR